MAIRDEVLERLAALIREIVAEPWVDDVPIRFETSFSQDLELESIEFVALAERLQAEFGQEVDFAGWLAGKELGEIIDLRIDEVVDFIVTCQASDTAV